MSSYFLLLDFNDAWVKECNRFLFAVSVLVISARKFKLALM